MLLIFFSNQKLHKQQRRQNVFSRMYYSRDGTAVKVRSPHNMNPEPSGFRPPGVDPELHLGGLVSSALASQVV